MNALALAVIGLPLIVGGIFGLAWLSARGRKPDPNQHKAAGPLLDRTDPWA